MQPEPFYSQGPPAIDAVPEIIQLHESPVVGWGKKKNKEEDSQKASTSSHTYHEKTKAEMMQMLLDVPLEEEDGGWEREMDI